MDHNVPHRDDLAPRNLLVRFAPIDGQTRRRFANQLDASFQRPTKFAIRVQIFASPSGDKGRDFVSKLHNLPQRQTGIMDAHKV